MTVRAVAGPDAPTGRDSARRMAGQLAGALRAGGSRHVFGVPGGGNNLDMIGAAQEVDLDFVLGHTETAAAIAAAVYADITGTATACLVTRGPGATSAVNGLAQAMLDRQPLVLVTDVVGVAGRPRTTHQSVDQRGILGSLALGSATLGHHGGEQVGAAAVALATGWQPGPVHLDFDPDYPHLDQLPSGDRIGASRLPAAAVALLRASCRPVAIVGVGALGAADVVREFLLGTGIPALQTYRATGVLPAQAPGAAGSFTGAAAEQPLLDQADLVLCIGFDAVEAIPGPWTAPAPVLSLGAWARADAYLPEHLEVVGDLSILVPAAAVHLSSSWEPGAAAMHRAEIDRALRASAPTSSGLHPHQVVDAVGRLMGRQTTVTVTVDAGAHMLVAMALLPARRPRQVLVSSGLATMGFALPAAIGVALARPHDRVVCLTGDGGLAMVLGELETIARRGLPVTVVVFNDSALTLIELKQDDEGQGGPAAVHYRPTDFAAAAGALGIPGQRISCLEELDRALSASATAPGPALLDVRVDPTSYVEAMKVLRGARACLRPVGS